MDRIKTVVVLVQENRSFDHMLGWMKSLNPAINGVTGQESNPLSTSDPASRTIFFGDQSEYVDPDPGHSIQAIYEQVQKSFYARILKYHTPRDLSIMGGFTFARISIHVIIIIIVIIINCCCFYGDRCTACPSRPARRRSRRRT